jgi:hypothetical protein
LLSSLGTTGTSFGGIHPERKEQEWVGLLSLCLQRNVAQMMSKNQDKDEENEASAYLGRLACSHSWQLYSIGLFYLPENVPFMCQSFGTFRERLHTCKV